MVFFIADHIQKEQNHHIKNIFKPPDEIEIDEDDSGIELGYYSDQYEWSDDDYEATREELLEMKEFVENDWEASTESESFSNLQLEANVDDTSVSFSRMGKNFFGMLTGMSNEQTTSFFSYFISSNSHFDSWVDP